MVMVGMGFATIENLMCMFWCRHSSEQWAAAGMRAITAVPACQFAIVMMDTTPDLPNSARQREVVNAKILSHATILHGFTISSCSRISIERYCHRCIGFTYHWNQILSEGMRMHRILPLSESRNYRAIASEDEDEGHLNRLTNRADIDR